MTEPRVIKKYPNRRLYDTQESRYITLADIRQLVEYRVPVRVVDRQSRRDITPQILLQVVADEEQDEGRPSALSVAFLEAIIRSYGNGRAGHLAPFLAHCARLLENADLERTPVDPRQLSEELTRLLRRDVGPTETGLS